MRLLKKSISAKDGEGFAHLLPEVPEDLWHAYNLLAVGDLLTAPTVRKVVKDGAGGATKSKRVTTKLTIEVEEIHFDAKAPAIHVKGRNKVQNPHVKMGAYHTIDLEVTRAFSIQKPSWDAIYLERLEQACDFAANADVAAVTMTQNTASLCLLSGAMTTVRAKIEVNIPKKRPGQSGHRKRLAQFYETILQAIVRHVDWEVVKTLLIASPGFYKDDFYRYLMAECEKRKELRQIIDCKDRILLVHATTGTARAVREVLADSGVLTRLSDSKAAGEVAVLNAFFEMLRVDPERAYYGYDHVRKCHEAGAIETLLVTDGLFRAADLPTRRRYVDLTDDVKAAGARVVVFSSLHASGEQLEQITGVAALLRFPVPGIDDAVEVDADEPSSTDSDSDDSSSDEDASEDGWRAAAGLVRVDSRTTLPGEAAGGAGGAGRDSPSTASISRRAGDDRSVASSTAASDRDAVGEGGEIFVPDTLMGGTRIGAARDGGDEDSGDGPDDTERAREDLADMGL